jgi:hypothetical protein
MKVNRALLVAGIQNNMLSQAPHPPGHLTSSKSKNSAIVAMANFSPLIQFLSADKNTNQTKTLCPGETSQICHLSKMAKRSWICQLNEEVYWFWFQFIQHISNMSWLPTLTLN